MKIRHLDAIGVCKELQNQLKQCDEAWVAIAWATDNPARKSLLDAKNKLTSLIIGVDFIQTNPDVLNDWCNAKVARVYPPCAGVTFHPKLYLFREGERGLAIVGSSNFTQGGLATNHEVSLFVEGNWDEEVFQSLKSQISNWWKDGKVISKAWLDQYRLRWESDRAARSKLSEPFRYVNPIKNAPHSWLPGLDWSQYVQTVVDAKDKKLEMRLKMLAKVQKIFREQDDFQAMTLEERRAIAGLHVPFSRSDLDDFEWGWFGSMTGAGEFYSRINNYQSELSAALACIPLTGGVIKQHYLDFIELYKLAFVDAERKGRVPTASRLLAMKRPDYFVCVNSQNQNGLSADLGYAKTRLSLDNYWDWVVQPILDSRWWNARRPRRNGPNDWAPNLWDCRVAMLDSIYY